MCLPQRQRLLRPRRRQLGDASGLARDAARLDRTGAAIRYALAHRRAQIHQPLGVGLEIALWQQALGQRPKVFVVNPVTSRQHALDVAVEDRGALAERERGDRRRGGAPDAGQLGDGFCGSRESVRCRSPRRLCAGCARARSSPARSTAAAPRPPTPRRAPSSSDTWPGSARNRESRRSPASAAASLPTARCDKGRACPATAGCAGRAGAASRSSVVRKRHGVPFSQNGCVHPAPHRPGGPRHAAVGLIAFSLFRFVGDPVAFMLGQDATAEQRAEVTRSARARPAVLRPVRCVSSATRCRASSA